MYVSNVYMSVFTHVASTHANLLDEKSLTPTGLSWDNNVAAVSVF